MKLMKTTEAVGQVLCHDITQIIPGVKKDAVFRKGHIITKEDIPVLLSVGKDTIYNFVYYLNKKNTSSHMEVLVHQEEFESPTFRFVAECSIQLSYWCMSV